MHRRGELIGSCSLGRLNRDLLVRTMRPLIVVAIGVIAQVVHASEPSSREIVLGMSTALTGPAADLGLNMRAGVQAALDEANSTGGVNGRTLRLVTLDDGYEPSRTAPNMRALVEEHDVLTIIGNVGTPTAVAAIPIALESKTPFFGAFTGAGVLRKSPSDRYVVNYRASYAEETAAMVDALIQHAGLKPEEVAFFTQRDAYGDAGYVGGIDALRRHGLTDESRIAHGRYERNTLAVENGLADILLADAPVRAVIMVGAYAPCAKFIEQAREYELDAIFLNVSFVGTQSLAKALGEHGEGVIITQVVPHPDSDAPIVSEYHRAMEASQPDEEPGFGSLEGYVAARVYMHALASIRGAPTKEKVIDALEALGHFDIGLGVPLALTSDDHQASHTVWPTVLRNGEARPLDWSELASWNSIAIAE